MHTFNNVILLLFLALVQLNLFAESVRLDDSLFRSKIITTQTKGHAVEVRAKIKGVQNLYLTVSDAGDSHTCDWADWAYPRLIKANGEETKLTDLNWKSAKTAWGKINLDKNCGGGSLTINGKAIDLSLIHI